MAEELNRRKFLTYVGTGVTALTVASTGLGAFTPKVEAKGAKAASHLFGLKKKVSGLNFKPIQPTDKDELVLPRGYKYDVVAAYGDVINKKGDTFGYNNDFTMFFPMRGSNDRGLLWVNHEYISDLWVTGPKKNGKFSKAQIEKLLYNQGGSIIEIYRDEDGVWKMDKNSKFARRITGLTPFKLTGPAKGSKTVGGKDVVQGTFANCSGGKTLWNTVLSAEENYESTVGDASLNETHYGWIVEVDPFNESFAPRKHTALGRFHHENSAMGLTNDGRVVVYMGDDKRDACVYKFISKGKYVKSRKQANSALLEEGTLYAANLKKGEWIALTIDAVRKAVKDNKELLEKFQTQADVLVYADEAAVLLGATPTDRPEDVEISPFDKSVFIAHTNNSDHGNIHGHITRFIEANDDLGSLTFDFEIFACGGRQSGFSAPDNLTFDSAGNLWTVTDISSSSMNKGVFSTFKNNGVFVIPTLGDKQGEAFQFASAPTDAELTGPYFTDDETALFLSVQHPGENTEDIKNPTSMWPHRKGDNQPRPAVVAISGFKY
ncbi:PhoX family protein [Bacillus xiapuensis]|uniref:PhoX family protein n=1 Tax=Bacillus xiapuensis TaxID=2014075 RepID=UPI000C232183|nr:alkaline phosphatase PhoX [Bacillus xiapuensis]